MTTLKDHILRRIRTEGPLTVAEYMSLCLLHPTLGYYTNREPFGAAGDFVTAPDISQMFGEMLGLCLAQGWRDQGQPVPFSLVELGPGRGTLMSDLLRAAQQVPGFAEAAQIHLVEASDRLRAIQRNALEDVCVQFVADPGELPQQSVFFVANEFFDALPVRQFQCGDSGWHERHIGAEAETLVMGLGPETAPPILDKRENTRPGEVVEIRPQAGPVITELTTRIETHGGIGLVIDYGDWRSRGDTFQAVRGHETVSPLEDPGHADLTAHVDFEAIAAAAACAHSRLAPQGVFLERLGITARAEALARRLDGEALRQHISAHQRLTHPDEMGNLFKVLGLFPRGTPPPPGLEP